MKGCSAEPKLFCMKTWTSLLLENIFIFLPTSWQSLNSCMKLSILSDMFSSSEHWAQSNKFCFKKKISKQESLYRIIELFKKECLQLESLSYTWWRCFLFSTSMKFYSYIPTLEAPRQRTNNMVKWFPWSWKLKSVPLQYKMSDEKYKTNLFWKRHYSWSCNESNDLTRISD